MHKKKDVEWLHSDEDFDGEDESFQEEPTRQAKSGYRHKHRLQIKKRMDDYEEYMWKKRNGWFDDELYSFSEDDSSPEP